MARPHIFFPILLAKAVLRRASIVSSSQMVADASKQFDRSAYVIKVLEAPAAIRETVRLTAAQSNSLGQTQLVSVLTMFEALSDENKAAFILAYRGCATLAAQGLREVVRAQAWDQEHIPPRQEP